MDLLQEFKNRELTINIEGISDDVRIELIKCLLPTEMFTEAMWHYKNIRAGSHDSLFYYGTDELFIGKGMKAEHFLSRLKESSYEIALRAFVEDFNNILERAEDLLVSELPGNEAYSREAKIKQYIALHNASTNLIIQRED